LSTYGDARVDRATATYCRLQTNRPRPTCLSTTWPSPPNGQSRSAFISDIEDQNAEDNDPRVFFSAERTLLAWLRTGLAVVGVGFLVARFGLSSRLLQQPDVTSTTPPLLPSVIGVGFVLLGSAMIGFSAWQHSRFIRCLTFTQRPQNYNTWFAAATSLLVSLLGLTLAGYLIVSIL